MIDNDKVYPCACKVRGQQHVYTTDASGNFILIVDPANIHLLRDTSYTVSPVHRRSKTSPRPRYPSRALHQKGASVAPAGNERKEG